MAFGPGADGYQTHSPEAQQAFDAALNAHDGGDLAAAEAKYREAVSLDPQMTVACNNLGMVLIQQDRLEEAVTALQQAANTDPTYAEAFNNLGFACRRMGRDAEAANYYEQFLALTPDVEDAPKILDWIDRVRAETGGAPAAAPAAEYAPEPESPPPAEQGVSPAEFFSGDQDFQQFFESSGDPGPAQVPAAEPAAAAPAAESEGPLSDRAEEEFAAMFGDLDGGGGEAAVAPIDAGDVDEEIGHLYTEAMTKFQDGDMGEAAHFCSLALEKAPNHYPTLLLAGRVALSRQDYTRATALLQKAAEVRVDDPEVHYFLGQCYEKRGLIDEAQEVYNRCLEVAPEGPRAKRLAKWIEKRRGEGGLVEGKGRCELCLRTVPEEDISVHEGRRVCSSCLETLGAKRPSPSVPSSVSRPDDTDPKAEKRVVAKKSGGSCASTLLLLLLLVILGAGGYVALSYFRVADLPLPKFVADLLPKRPPVRPVTPVTPVNPVTPTTSVKIVPQEMTFIPIVDPMVMPLQRFTLRPELKVVWRGAGAAPPKAEPIVFELVQGPRGMSIDAGDGTLVWTPGIGGKLEVPSDQEVIVKATCGEKMAQKSFMVLVRYVTRGARDVDVRMVGAHRASLLAMTFGDFDSDGRPDLVSACGGALEGRINMLLSGGGAAEFTSTRGWDLNCGPAGLCVADLDGDGRQDLGWAGWIDGRLHVLRGTAGNPPSKPMGSSGPGAAVEAVLAADLDGDGSAELVTASRRAGLISVFGGRGGKVAEIKMPYCGLPPLICRMGAVPGTKGSRFGVVISGGEKPGSFRVYALRGKSLRQEQSLELASGVVVGARGGDFDGDGNLDVAVVFGGSSGVLTVVDGSDPKKLALLQPVAVGELPIGMACADLNADGRHDVVLTSPEEVRIYLSTGKGSFLAVGGEKFAGGERFAGLAGPVAVWPSQKGRPGRIAVLNLKGRAWIMSLPAPPKELPAAPRPEPSSSPAGGGKKED